MPGNYVRFRTLIAEWSQQSGELPPVILTNLCEQEARGRFPPGTFRHIRTGGWSDPGFLAELAKQMCFSEYDWMRGEAAETLDKIAVSKAGVLSYCNAHGVLPPRCVAGFWKLLFWGEARYQSPPHYPSTPEEIAEEEKEAERQEAAEKERHEAELEACAEGEVSQLEVTLSRIEVWTQEGEEIVWGFWTERWGDSKGLAENSIEQLSDQTRADALTKRLTELDSKFTSLRAQADEAIDAAREADAARAETDGRPQVKATVAAESRARRYLEEQVSIGNWQPRPEHFAAARAVCGEGLSERAFNRAWADVVPAEWRKPGRRSTHHKNRTEERGENASVGSKNSAPE